MKTPSVICYRIADRLNRIGLLGNGWPVESVSRSPCDSRNRDYIAETISEAMPEALSEADKNKFNIMTQRLDHAIEAENGKDVK